MTKRGREKSNRVHGYRGEIVRDSLWILEIVNGYRGRDCSIQIHEIEFMDIGGEIAI